MIHSCVSVFQSGQASRVFSPDIQACQNDLKSFSTKSGYSRSSGKINASSAQVSAVNSGTYSGRADFTSNKYETIKAKQTIVFGRMVL